MSAELTPPRPSRKFTGDRRKADCFRRLFVLTNSLATTDVTAVHGAYAHYRKPLLVDGVSLYKLRPQIIARNISLFGSSGANLHTKAFIVDGKSCFIDSFNVDPHSISLNTEMGVLFEDPAPTSEANAVFADEISLVSSYKLRNKTEKQPGRVGPEPARSC